MYSSMPFANKYSFISPLPNCRLDFFFIVIALARISVYCPHKNESRHLYLVPDLRGKTSSFSLLSMMLTIGVFFVDVLHQVERVLLHSWLTESFFFFLSQTGVGVCQVVTTSIDMISDFSSLAG